MDSPGIRRGRGGEEAGGWFCHLALAAIKGGERSVGNPRSDRAGMGADPWPL